MYTYTLHDLKADRSAMAEEDAAHIIKLNLFFWTHLVDLEGDTLIYNMHYDMCMHTQSQTLTRNS